LYESDLGEPEGCEIIPLRDEHGIGQGFGASDRECDPDAGKRIRSLVGGAGSTHSRWKGNHLFPYPADMLMERGCQLS
jgi:hypothetical protein